jgi:hypothetical protein
VLVLVLPYLSYSTVKMCYLVLLTLVFTMSHICVHSTGTTNPHLHRHRHRHLPGATKRSKRVQVAADAACWDGHQRRKSNRAMTMRSPPSFPLFHDGPRVTSYGNPCTLLAALRWTSQRSRLLVVLECTLTVLLLLYESALRAS